MKIHPRLAGGLTGIIYLIITFAIDIIFKTHFCGSIIFYVIGCIITGGVFIYVNRKNK